MKHNPRQTECTICIRSKKNCDHIDFSKMKPIDIYDGVAVIVICDKYVERER